MILRKNGIVVPEYVPTYVGKKLVIGIDSSKSNTGIAVGDEEGNILDDYEISGAGSDVDVYDLCRDTRAALKSLFKGSEILLVGIEDIITKKQRGYKGIEIHQSRHKITAVFDNYTFLFEEYFNIRPIRINNWDWKSHILPEEYRKATHDKGSLDWFNDLGNKWAGRKDDVTDAVCILMYLYKMRKSSINRVYSIVNVVPTSNEYLVAIVPKSYTINNSVRRFEIKNDEDLIKNLDSMCSMLPEHKVGSVVVPIEKIPIDWIYSDKLCCTNEFSFDRVTDEVMILIQKVFK